VGAVEALSEALEDPAVHRAAGQALEKIGGEMLGDSD
jgi:hypothetical protein